MHYKKILQHIYSLESSKIKLGLENVKELLAKIGNPEKELKCIHVAGTNGKGSVCAMIFCMLREAGYDTGLYTSPHLKRFNERIRVNDKLIADREIVKYYMKIKPYITNQSFFEITTVIAFLYFKDKKADFVVLEVGLGGRLDATNAVTPLVSVITNIGMEHTDLLGKTIGKIAFEKAGIIKKNIPIVTGARGKALEAIKKIARERNAPLHIAREHRKIRFRHLNGEFQQENAEIALTSMEVLKKYQPVKISKKQIYYGIEKTTWPARMQFISKNVLVDCAHNPSGFKALKHELGIIKKQKKFGSFIFVIGILKDKDFEEMLKVISPLTSQIVFTKSGNKRSCEPEELLKVFKKINKNKKIKACIVKNPKKALEYAKKTASKGDLVVVAGSIYMVGEVI